MCVLLRRFPEISPTDHPKTPISSYASTGEPISLVNCVQNAFWRDSLHIFQGICLIAYINFISSFLSD